MTIIMKYVTPAGFDSPLVEAQLLHVDYRSHSRSMPAVLPQEVVDLDRLIRCFICRPRILRVDDGISLVFCGFRIRVQSPARLVWIRLLVTVASHGHAPISPLPRSVMHPFALGGRFSIDDNGFLHRDAVSTESRARSVSHFEPSFFGALANKKAIFWDVVPKGSEVPNGCDQLAFTLGGSSATSVELRARIMLAASISDEKNETYLEMPVEDLQIEEIDGSL
jgi:hypothetical protein